MPASEGYTSKVSDLSYLAMKQTPKLVPIPTNSLILFSVTPYSGIQIS